MNQAVTALLGRKDEPTDAVEEYCRYLSRALEITRFKWTFGECPGKFTVVRIAERAETHGYALAGAWVLVQYTALGWSSRGFPQKVLRVLKILKSADARVGIVFHDVRPYHGTHPGGSRFAGSSRSARCAVLSRFAISPSSPCHPKNYPGFPQVRPVQSSFLLAQIFPSLLTLSQGLRAMTCPRLVCSASPVATWSARNKDHSRRGALRRC